MPKTKIRALLSNEKIDLFSFLSLDDCRITKKYLLDRAEIESGSVIIMAVPYISENFGKGNISEYAKCRDYHLFFKELFSRILPLLNKEFPKNKFIGFADHSPIDEKHAAALAKLGVIGKNSLLITEKYSSFVFLGEIITDMTLESEATEIGFCNGCGRCLNSCPFSVDPRTSCLSAITQKKGELTEDEVRLMKSVGTVWGCDACQTACPYTAKALEKRTIYTEIPFFLEERISHLTYRLIAEMSDSDFSKRAYSWRGRETLLRNLKFFEE